MSGPWYRTIKRDLEYFAVLDKGDLAPKEVARIFSVKAHVIYDAMERRRRNRDAYQMFHSEQLTKTDQSRSIEMRDSNA